MVPARPWPKLELNVCVMMTETEFNIAGIPLCTTVGIPLCTGERLKTMYGTKVNKYTKQIQTNFYNTDDVMCRMYHRIVKLVGEN